MAGMIFSTFENNGDRNSLDLSSPLRPWEKNASGEDDVLTRELTEALQERDTTVEKLKTGARNALEKFRSPARRSWSKKLRSFAVVCPT